MASTEETQEKETEEKAMTPHEWEPKMYTLEELNEAININLIIGACIGVAVTLVAEVLYAWAHGWL